jgi:hypothetical protein
LSAVDDQRDREIMPEPLDWLTDTVEMLENLRSGRLLGIPVFTWAILRGKRSLQQEVRQEPVESSTAGAVSEVCSQRPEETFEYWNLPAPVQECEARLEELQTKPRPYLAFVAYLEVLASEGKGRDEAMALALRLGTRRDEDKEVFDRICRAFEEAEREDTGHGSVYRRVGSAPPDNFDTWRRYKNHARQHIVGSARSARGVTRSVRQYIEVATRHDQPE